MRSLAGSLAGSLVGAGAAFAVGAVSGVAAILIHQAWWGLVLGLATALVTLVWLPPGVVRLGYVVGWMVPVVRGAVALPAGDFLIAADAAGWSFLAGSFALLLAALATSRARSRCVEDHEIRGPAT